MKRLCKVSVYSSINKVKKDTYDGAFILTPPNTHFKIAYSLIDSGKNVFVEKPLTLSSDHSQQLVDLAILRNVQISVGYVYRHHPVFKHLKAILKEDVLGSIKSVEMNMSGNVVSSETQNTWRNKGFGSGCLYDYGCHIIDLSLFFFGRPKNTYCIDKQELFQKGVVDKFSASLFYDDFNVDINCNWADSSLRKAAIFIKIVTDKNTIWTDGQRLEIEGVNSAKYNIKDLKTDTSYYLRGEEFQTQLDIFHSNLSNFTKDYTGAKDAAFCDQIIQKLVEY